MHRHAAAPGAAVGCPVTADRGLGEPGLYRDLGFRAEMTRMRAAGRLVWTDVGDTGYFSAVRYADVDRVLRDSDTFTSEGGTLLNLLGTDDAAAGRQIAATDPPRHTAMRARVQKALGIRAIERRQDTIAGFAREVLAPLGDGATFDFAAAMTALPVAVAGDAMALPRADWPRLGRLLTTAIAPEDPEYRTARTPELTLARAHRELFAYFQDICAERRHRLGDDLVSALITTEVDGRTLSAGEVVANCYSVLLGAVVTTAQPPNYVMTELLGSAALAAWAADPGRTPGAVEEVLRLASPANHFMRYAVTDTEIRGTRIAAGQAVVAWIGSANRDAAVFAEPDRFDPHRHPNRHLAFGVGPHYCVGHGVARVTLRIVFDELLSRFTEFQPAGDPVRLHSNVVSGWKHVPITATAVRRTR